MMLLPLVCCDLVLGIEWLVTLGDIIWIFDKLSVEFSINGKKHVLRGASFTNIKTIRKQQVTKALKEGFHLSVLQFTDIFDEPTSLPPKRLGYDHKIPLMQGSNPMNKGPYRYAKQHKDEIDRLVKESLKSGIIQPSNSPYASTVVLVGKKDGSWRMCVDYRELNKNTVKDRFPIPLVDDLLDELYGSLIFSKINLRFGYNQVRMDPIDIHKTAFKTHSGHFEYLVMPFGPTNAPATFQGLMNEIFKDYLRMFLLVFFLLQPLPIPEHVWQHITMDVIEGLPSSYEKQVIFVVVDRLSKAAHFMALARPYTVAEVAQSFLDNVFKLHGFYESIIGDRDSIFVSQLWKELLAFQGVQIQLSTAYHPQTDGQSEFVTRCLETYLRCMYADTPLQWSKWLALAERWYNTNYHNTINANPCEIVYAQDRMK
uniref:Transposon Ty3-G Gag-Pol polyprotein n=1 Tax=Cajanus cajan TaxID=3821 RepID=A0A151QMN5_CAJCA|nr:Transposon Ty3-G Gag-Pol polyprotein [Cajanus cajan]